jgi:hypothetical protein
MNYESYSSKKQTFFEDAEIDRAIDLMPYSENRHLKLSLFDKYISTSVALIIKKGQA